MEISKYIEYTKLDNKLTMKDIEKICNDAIKYHFETVCINPYYVPLVSSLLKDTNILVSTVISYPLGASTTSSKVYETIEAINNGASEIDLVVNISSLKNEDYEYIIDEIEEIRDSIDGRTLKVIVDVDSLTKEEIIKMVEICNSTFVNYIALSTNYGIDKIEQIIKIIEENKNDILEIKVNSDIRMMSDISRLIDIKISRIGINNIEFMEVNNENI